LRWFRIGVSNRTSGFWVGWSSFTSEEPDMIIFGEGARQMVDWSSDPMYFAFEPFRLTTQQGSWPQWYQRTTDREETFVPDHLADDVEADPDESLGDLGGVDAGVPDVADGERRHEGEGVGPVDPGIARHGRVPVALGPEVWQLGRAERVIHAVAPGGIEGDAVRRIGR
jgi:hypothetical protein